MTTPDQPKMNFIAVIGCVVAVCSFGFNSVAGYARLEARMAVMEYQVSTLLQRSTNNQEILKRLDKQPER